MTPDERSTINLFKAAVNLIPTGADRYPIPHPDRVSDLGLLARYVLKVDMILLGRDDLNAEERSLLNLADATSKWIAEFESGSRDPAIAEAWFRARAELVEPKE